MINSITTNVMVLIKTGQHDYVYVVIRSEQDHYSPDFLTYASVGTKSFIILCFSYIYQL